MNRDKRSSTALIVAAWAAVTIPAAWGIYNTALNAAKLFGTVKQSGSDIPSVRQPANAKQ
jgi:hypothetical protein